jgi:uncharacterized membrane protein YeaQ/YmgE (transglycosylase-associated protein family)
VGLVFLIVTGGMLGWLAAIIAEAETGPAHMHNILVGIGGALTGGLVVNALLGKGNLLAGQYSVDALVVALVETIAVLVALNLVRPGKPRPEPWSETDFNRGRDRLDAPPHNAKRKQT